MDLDIIYGETTLDRVHRRGVEEAVSKSGISGTLYFGYPVLSTADGRQPIDALLVGHECGVVGILVFKSLPTSDELHSLATQQDGLYSALETHLSQHSALRVRRKLAVDLRTITLLPGDPPELEGDLDAEFSSVVAFGDWLKKQETAPMDEALFKRLRSVVEHVVALKPAKKRENVKLEQSRGAKLKRIEQEIANLDRWQKQAAIATPEGAQRIRGLAGSGKTVVLALKAAYLHAQHPDWRIAVVFYTQSLYQQFVDLIRRFCFEHLRDEPDWSKIRVLHAWGSSYRQGFYYEVAEMAGCSARNFASAMAQYGREDAFAGSCAELAAAASNLADAKCYDAVLIDEAQDLPSSFFRLVYDATKSPKRIVWAYDELQQLSAENVPGAAELFGVDQSGKALIDLDDSPGEAEHDVVLPICYRNPPWTLTVAHALGFGTARTPDLVQHFDDPSLWVDVGYVCKSGTLKLGESVELERRVDSFPEFFRRELTADDAISFHQFESDAEQLEWVVSQVQTQLRDEELEHDDFLIVLPNEYTAKSRGAKLVSAFGQRNIRAHLAGVETDRNVVFQDNSIAIAHIYRAKGNEAPFVFVLDSEFASSGNAPGGAGLASRRNKLFTAMTRSRAWVRVCGVGPAMSEIKSEFDKVKADGFILKFRIPSLPDLGRLRMLHRDRTEAEIQRLRKQKEGVEELATAYARGEVSREILDALPENLRSALRDLFAGE